VGARFSEPVQTGPGAHPASCTGLFISPSGISELDCTTTKTDTVERSISIDRESLKVFFLTRRRGVLAGFAARGAVVTKHGVDRE
jgi:hypothetical protein